MVAQGMDEQITLNKLLQLKQRAIQCGKLEELEIEGLTLERALVFPSGLSILIAIFRELQIDSMTLAGGALREGLVYGMLNLPIDKDIRTRTLHNIQNRFSIDAEQATRVEQLAEVFFRQVSQSWKLDARCRELLQSACAIHEIGLSVDHRQAPRHSAYLVRSLDLPGFTPAQKNLLSSLLENQQGSIDLALLAGQNALPPRLAERICRLLRLAIIFSSRRRDNTLPAVRLQADDEEMHLTLPAGWLEAHPLRAEFLEQECHYQSYVHWTLTLS